MSGLPDRWKTCRLGDVVDYGATSKAEPDTILADAWVLALEDIEKDTSKVLQRLTLAQRQSQSAKNRFAAGDVLYGKLRPYLNKVVCADQAGFCTTEIIPLKPSEWLVGRYLFYWLKSPTFLDYVMAESHGLNMPRLGTKAGRDAPFVLAPLNEQRRIADKLDAILARVDACRDRLDQVPAIVKRFRHSVLNAATSGDLTDQWRAYQATETHSQIPPTRAARDSLVSSPLNSQEPGLTVPISASAGWKETAFDAECDEITVGFVGKMSSEYREIGIPFLRSLNVRPFRLDPQDLRFISPEFHKQIKKSALRPGDVVVVRTGAPGQCCVIPTTFSDANCSDLVIVRPSKQLLPEFACVFINAETSQKFVRSEQVGVAQSHFNVGSMKRAPLSLPPLAEQTEIVRRVESLFAYADHLEARYHAARSQIDRLTPALLAKAFRGELVPQDPDDEPADLLLERVRAARASASPRPRKRGGHHAAKTPKPEPTMLNRQDIESNHLAAILDERGPLTAEALWSAAQLDIDDFYDQLKDEEARGLLMERQGNSATAPRLLEATA